MSQYLLDRVDELIDHIKKQENEISTLKEAVSLLAKRGHRDMNQESDEIESQKQPRFRITLQEITDILNASKDDQQNGLERKLRDSGGKIYDNVW